MKANEIQIKTFNREDLANTFLSSCDDSVELIDVKLSTYGFRGQYSSTSEKTYLLIIKYTETEQESTSNK